ncbi:MAG TPA: hypothetical protein VJB57_18420 [Dehalococcoidia bacterium]|nr:hypothetical protein [Dehalococcoidia bacterium]
MNRSKSTLLAVGGTFLLLVAGIAGGGFFGGVRSASSQIPPSRVSLMTAVSSPGVTSDTPAPAAPAIDQRSRRGSNYDDDDDDGDDRLEGKTIESRRGERHNDERRESDDR